MGKVEDGQNMSDSNQAEGLPTEVGPAFPVKNTTHIAHCGEAIKAIGDAIDLFSLDNQARIRNIQALFPPGQQPESVYLHEDFLVELYSLNEPALGEARRLMHITLHEELRTDATVIGADSDYLKLAAEKLAGRADLDDKLTGKVKDIRVAMEQQTKRVAVYKEVIRRALLPGLDEGIKDLLINWAGHTESGEKLVAQDLGIEGDLTEQQYFYGLFRKDLVFVDQHRLEVAAKLGQAGIQHGGVQNLTQELRQTDAVEGS